MQMPELTEAHRRLERLAGNWSGKERIHPSPMDPTGGEAEGRACNRLALGGFVLLHDYQQERQGAVRFAGHAVLRHDSSSGDYVLHWFDSFGLPPSEYRGGFEGDVLTLVSREPHGHSRATWDLSRPGTYRFRMEVSPDGERWIPFLEGEYQQEG